MRRILTLALLFSLCTLAAAQDQSHVAPQNDWKQNISRFETFAGYELFRVSPSSRANVNVTQLDLFRTNGATGSVQFNVNSYVGLVGEFGATRASGIGLGSSVGMNQTQLSYLFGPRVFVRFTNRIVPFMEFLGGGVHDSRTFDVPNARINPVAVVPQGVTSQVGADTTRFHLTQNAFALAIGTGVNVNVTRTMGFRPIQVDCVGTRLAPVSIPGVPGGINDSRWQVNWKYSTGVTFRFGGMQQVDRD